MRDRTGYLAVPEVGADDVEHRRQLARGVNTALQGKLNAVTEIKLDANASTTTIVDARITVKSFLSFTPLTASAAAEIGNGTLYLSSQTTGSAVVAHANNAQTDRTYKLLMIG